MYNCFLPLCTTAAAAAAATNTTTKQFIRCSKLHINLNGKSEVREANQKHVVKWQEFVTPEENETC